MDSSQKCSGLNLEHKHGRRKESKRPITHKVGDVSTLAEFPGVQESMRQTPCTAGNLNSSLKFFFSITSFSKLKFTLTIEIKIKNIINLPMQLRGPALNGRYAYGCLSLVRSGKKLSGLNVSGSGK